MTPSGARLSNYRAEGRVWKCRPGCVPPPLHLPVWISCSEFLSGQDGQDDHRCDCGCNPGGEIN